MQVIVSQKHIDAGTPKCGDKCPLALALRDAGIPVGTVHSPGKIHTSKGHQYLPANAVAWLADYDESPDSAKPFTFDLAT